MICNFPTGDGKNPPSVSLLQTKQFDIVTEFFISPDKKGQIMNL